MTFDPEKFGQRMSAIVRDTVARFEATGEGAAMRRRVVITGLGMVTPLACGVEETWSRLLDGRGE